MTDYLAYDTSIPYLQFAVQNSTSGSSVDSRYISNIQWSYVYLKMAMIDTIITFTVLCTTYRVVQFNTVTSEVTIRDFSGTYLYSTETDLTSGR